MKLGLFGINMGPCSTPDASVRVAQAAEAAGFESVWAGEHVVLPDPQEPPSPLPPTYPMLDPNIAFAFLAGQTRTIRMGTGIIILPQRNPLVLAKEMASLDVLSGGRLIFGVGIGYLRPEFDALGAPFGIRDRARSITLMPCGRFGVRTTRPTRGSLPLLAGSRHFPSQSSSPVRRLFLAA